uniref:uncharacterized protein LOC105352364 n=1 Tax=Fragaria vesca subsp. vesca TaxID=101020 RepID=UPI0005C96F8B|nr:PREDICTED: uncharacterized protein LOC105352364 [Fragaria vesca subsp. vesca]
MTDVPSAPIPSSHKMQPDPPTVEDPAKKSKPNITDEMRQHALDHLSKSIRDKVPNDVLDRLHLTREDLLLSQDDRLAKSYKGAFQKIAEQGGHPWEMDYDEPKYGPDDNLPEGHDWASYIPGSGTKDFVVKMHCCICGVGLDHWPEHCPQKKG